MAADDTSEAKPLEGLDLESRQMVLDTIGQLKKRLLTKEKIFEFDRKEIFPEETIREMLGPEIGLQLLMIPEEYGGMGGGARDSCAVTREMAKICLGITTAFFAIQLGADPIIVGGTEKQKEKWLGRIAEGNALVAYAVTEPDAGSDTSAATTSAVKDGDDYVINGGKVMIGNGTVGTHMLVYCLTDPDAQSKTGRHSIILVETDREGYKADPMHGKMGLRASDTAAIYFNNCRVPRENLIGVEGNGFIQLMKFFDHSRAYVAAHGVGLAQGALDMAVKHVKGRQQFGRPIGAFQSTQFKIAEMAVKVETARNMTYKSAWLLDQGRPDTKLTAMAKMYACHAAVEVVDEALQLHGGYGYFNDYDIERFYRAAKVLEIYEGTKEVEKIIISREILGKL